MTDQELAKMTRIVDWRLNRWSTLPDFEDLRQEALIAAWRDIERCRREGKPWSLATIANRQAEWAAINYLRSPAAQCGFVRPDRPLPRPMLVSLEEMQERSLEEDDELPQDKRWGIPCQADFAPELIERLAIAGECRRLMNPWEWETVRECYLNEKGATAYAAEQGVTVSAIQQRLKRALNHCRAQLGLPLSCGRPGPWAGQRRKQPL